MSSPKKRLLLIAYHFPPSSEVGALRPLRFYRYLPSFGWSRSVVTASPPKDGAMDDVTFVADETAEFWRTGKGKPGRGAWWEKLVRRFLAPGGLGFRWAIDAAQACRDLIEKHPHQEVSIYSTYPPPSVHIAAMLVKRRANVRWIADFRDPMLSSVSEMPPLATRFNKWLERQIMRRADVIVCNADSAADALRNQFPREAAKITTIWNGYDPADEVAPLPVPARKQRVLIHAGSLYNNRNPNLVLESLERLRKRRLEGIADVRVDLVGTIGFKPGLNDELIAMGVTEGWIDFVPRRVPKEEALQRTLEADWLMLLQPQSELQVPGKLFELVRIGRPILAVAPKGSPIERILERCGVRFVCIYPDDPIGIVDGKLEQLLSFSAETTPPSAWFLETFDGRTQAGQLAELAARAK